ncbi:MAG: exodeoxyribonuclease VII small subunit [Clostridia bacterium]|nr:exodeoxyribonuclease VII small subunit [Clostridia bacterium]
MERQTFEQRLDEVKEIIEHIENGKLPLEDSVTQYERGMKTLAGLEKELDEMKRRITILQEDGTGTLTEREMEDV